jgi:2-polyprenyl-3-methyl-5-hydroxy-6-metoxy-1,4-benzoquinol methylase
MSKFIKKHYQQIARILPPRLLRKQEFKRQSFFGFNERPLEYGFVFKCIAKLSPKNVLDVGTGTTALPHLIRNCGPLVTAIDNKSDYWTSGMFNRHYHVLDQDITASKLNLTEKFDLITCISVLEHIENHDVAVKNMFSLLNEGGHLIITCPYTENEYVEDVYKLPESSVSGEKIFFICQSYSREKLNNWLSSNGGEIVDQEFWQLWDGDFWSTGERLTPPVSADSKAKHQISCILIKKTKTKS